MAQVTADVVGLQLERVRKKQILPKLFAWNDVTLNEISVREDVEQISSREMRIPINTSPGGNSGAFNPAGGSLGRGSAYKYDKAGITPIWSRHAVEINLDVEKQTDTKGEKAIVNIFNKETVNATKEFRFMHNAWLQTAGDGVMATITALPGANVFVCGNAPFYSQLLRKGQKYVVYDAALAAPRGTVTVTTATHATNRVTMDGTPAGTIVTDVLVPEGLSGATPAWFFGIPYHHNDAATGTWQTFNRANEPDIRSNRVNAGNQALTTPVIRLLLGKIMQRQGMVNPKSLIAHLHPCQMAAYEELGVLISNIQKGSGNEAIDLLFGEQKMAGIRPRPDIQAARNRIDFMNKESWGIAESMPIDYVKDRHGNYFTRPTDVTDGAPVAATLFHLACARQYFTDCPPTFGYVSDLAVPTGWDAM